jgi:hypothetical protein
LDGLISTLAFLSNTKDDLSHIPAAAIDEDFRLPQSGVPLVMNKDQQNNESLYPQ